MIRHFEIQNPKNTKLVCDLGSTGVVVALCEKNKIAIEAHLLNRQVKFGADVMTRLHSAQKLGVEPLQTALFETIEKCLSELQTQEPEALKHALVEGIFCSGNSAMTTFLHAWSITQLATSPFQPERFNHATVTAKIKTGSVELHTLPLLAGFVGGDTVAGLASILLAEDIRSKDEPWMLVDIGTNTEIVLYNGSDELWLCSAPAGPAFEGGNILCGMRAEPGAISAARYENGKWILDTIGNDLPKGICGSGLIDLLSQAVKSGLIEKDGFVPNGKITLVNEIQLIADDIREFQLAKSATRTAIDLMIDRANLLPKTLYLAGTFAQHLNLDSVKAIGLLPDSIPVVKLGNASLTGTALLANLSAQDREQFFKRLQAIKHPVELALQDDFQMKFVENLGF